MRISWPEWMSALSACSACELCRGCKQKVPGQGDLHAPLMLIGEGPGAVEDEQGLAFVGPAGQLLTKMLLAIGLPRESVYIGNVVKCRPPGNRAPTDEEIAACIGHLRGQFALIRPKVVLLLGATAVKAVLGSEYRITRCRGQWFEKKGCWFIATYHPSALLRDESKKKDAWYDLKLVRQKLCELSLYQELWKGEKA